VFKFIKKLHVVFHLLIALVLGFGLVVATTFLLDLYTAHGKTASVPNVTKKKLPDAIKQLESEGFKVIVDSVFKDSLPPLYILEQIPEAGAAVKKGRTVILVVNQTTAPLVKMPSLVGNSLYIALSKLERTGLRLGDTLKRPDFAMGRILKQLYNGKEIGPDQPIPMGSKITLIMGSGLGDLIQNYPDLYGMTLKQALAVLDTLYLSAGFVNLDKGSKDSLNAIVYKQFPPVIDPYSGLPQTGVRQGNVVDLWISNIPRPREVDTSVIKVTKGYIDGQDSLLSEKEKRAARAKREKQQKPENPAEEAPKPPTTPKPDDEY
jgi:eukaryotic-like serine/threonine-protein kinase